MMTYSYKTNINGLRCVGHIKPHLDKLEETNGIGHWQVNLNDPGNILTIETDSMTSAEVEAAIHAAGYKAEQVALQLDES